MTSPKTVNAEHGVCPQPDTPNTTFHNSINALGLKMASPSLEKILIPAEMLPVAVVFSDRGHCRSAETAKRV